MTRYGAQFGPDFTFLGVPECDLDDESSYADADVVILGAPFDGGTSYRAGARFGPQAIRMTDYLPHDGSRPSLALRTDGLADLKVYDAGDVEMYSGDIEVALPALEAAVQKVVQAGAIPVSLGGDHSIAYPDAKGCANVIGAGRVSMIHFDAHADTGDIEFGDGRYRVGKNRQDGDIDVLEGLLERALQVAAARPQGGQMIDRRDEMAELQSGAHLRTIVIGPHPQVGGVHRRALRHLHQLHQMV